MLSSSVSWQSVSLSSTTILPSAAFSKKTVKRFGFETRSTNSGEQALELLEGPDRTSISLVLLDLVMPGLDGMGVLDRLKGKSGPPVIVLTANGSIDAAIGAMRLGAVDFVDQAGFSPSVSKSRCAAP